jgi:SIR2-like domain
MKFLEVEFEESLIAEIAEDGRVLVGTTAFEPTYILKSDSEAYGIEFARWKSEEWLPPKLEKLVEILAVGNNRNRFADLLELTMLKKVVPFIGSGMSASSNMPMWTGFLWELQALSTLNALELEALLDAGQYEDAASALIAHMPNRLFDEKLEQTFRARQINSVSGAVKFLPRIFDSTIVTTNYDNILELIYQEMEIQFDAILCGKRIEDHPEFRGNNHGDLKRPGTRVLTMPEYEECYRDGSIFKAELSFMYQKNSLLFLGCSLQNDRTVSLLAEVALRDQLMPRHYTFLALPQTAEDKIAREHFLTERGIFPIWYPVQDKNHDEPIEALLVGLMEGMGRL